MQQNSIYEIKEFLRSKGINPSLQRIKIYQYLLKNRTHPRVEDIYAELVNEIPTLSKTTIYTTLNLFVSKGIVSKIMIEDGEVRYDIDTTPHGHFKCIKCGRVYDIDIKPSIFKDISTDGHQPIEYHFYVIGICKECLEKEKEEVAQA